MVAKSKQNGFSLTEMLVVIAIVALLTGLGLPAIRSLQKSFTKGSGILANIDAALSTARAIAAKEQRYAGVRFQLDMHGNQYMIFIIHDPEKTGLSNGFRALEGQKPIKLPDDIRVIDMLTHGPEVTDPGVPLSLGAGSFLREIDVEDFDPVRTENRYLRDISCFPIIFSPAGNLVIHEVRVRNRDGIYQPDNGESNDDIFNSLTSIQNRGIGMFIQDDYWEYGYGRDQSVSAFYIYDKKIFDKLGVGMPDPVAGDLRYDYIKKLNPVYINQYTGTIIKGNKK